MAFITKKNTCIYILLTFDVENFARKNRPKRVCEKFENGIRKPKIDGNMENRT